MKKLRILFLITSLSVVIASCHHGRRHVTIESNNHGYITRIEYLGTVVFNNSETGISNMSPHSYFKFKKGDESLEAKCDNRGRIIYELNNEKSSDALNNEGKSLLIEAIKAILKAQGKKG